VSVLGHDVDHCSAHVSTDILAVVEKTAEYSCVLHLSLLCGDIFSAILRARISLQLIDVLKVRIAEVHCACSSSIQMCTTWHDVTMLELVDHACGAMAMVPHIYGALIFY
jgi:hypothetical protein